MMAGGNHHADWWVAEAVSLIEKTTRSQQTGGSSLALVQAWENLRSQAISARLIWSWTASADGDFLPDIADQANMKDTMAAAVARSLWSLADASITAEHTTRTCYSAALALHACGATSEAAVLTALWRTHLIRTRTFTGWPRLAVLVSELHEVVPLQRDLSDLVREIRETKVIPDNHPWQREVIRDLSTITEAILRLEHKWLTPPLCRGLYTAVMPFTTDLPPNIHQLIATLQIRMQTEVGR